MANHHVVWPDVFEFQKIKSSSFPVNVPLDFFQCGSLTDDLLHWYAFFISFHHAQEVLKTLTRQGIYRGKVYSMERTCNSKPMRATRVYDHHQTFKCMYRTMTLELGWEHPTWMYSCGPAVGCHGRCVCQTSPWRNIHEWGTFAGITAMYSDASKNERSLKFVSSISLVACESAIHKSNPFPFPLLPPSEGIQDGCQDFQNQN